MQPPSTTLSCALRSMAFFALLLVGTVGCTKNADVHVQNQRVEAPSLLDDAGKSRNLADFEGAPLLVYFYPKDGTPGCVTEACSLRDAWDRYQRAGIHIVGVSGDSVKSHARFKEQHDLPFTLLSDPDKEFGKVFGVPVRMGMYARMSFLLDETGAVRAIFPEVDPALHADEVLQEAKSLGLTHSNEL